MSAKDSRVVRFFYDLPGIRSAYHFMWAWVGAKFRGNPSEKLFVIGVTGTKGKTTTLELLNAILEASGKKTALLSSLRMKIDKESVKNKTGNSMPGHARLQDFLVRAGKAGCRYALIEVTSQGVVMHRHRFIHWNAGVLTNLAPEHIESHGSFENYRNAKLQFLKYVLSRGGKVFLNSDDKHFPFFESALASTQKISYSRDDESLRGLFSRIKNAQMMRGEAAPKFLLSEFNAENIAVAVALARELGIGERVIEGALVEFSGVPGRMQFVTAGGYTGIVDYAHTPDSLEAAYRAAKPRSTPNASKPRLICILGAAGGGRDIWKRPEMGRVAARYCDEIFLANEDPYDEDPMGIMEEIEKGVRAEDPAHSAIPKFLDREEAILAAVSVAREGDVVIATGKGSEDWIHGAKGEKMAWNERESLERALVEKRKSGARS